MDFSDLETKVKWAIEHDKEAEQIAKNAKEFAKKHIHDTQLHCYTYLVALERARLMGIQL